MSVQIGLSPALADGREPAVPTHDRAVDSMGRSFVVTLASQGASVQVGPEAAMPSTGFGAQGTADSELGSSLLRMHLAQGKGSERVVAELYALGLQSVGHLSHLPSFLADTGLAPMDVMPLHAGVRSAPLVSTGLPSGSGGSQPQRVDAWVLSGAAVSQRDTVAGLASRELVQREAGALIAARWPDRRWQVTAGDEGLSLLIRDYHLSDEEEAALLADLTSRLLALDMAPARIWVNGRLLFGEGLVSGEGRAMTGPTNTEAHDGR